MPLDKQLKYSSERSKFFQEVKVLYKCDNITVSQPKIITARMLPDNLCLY